MRVLALVLLYSCGLSAASDWVLIRTTEGTEIEAQANLDALKMRPILSFHSGTPASEKEKERIAAGLAAVQGKDRAARDAAVEELTAIGVPVVSPLLAALKDTDQHEPRPLYRLFERVMPSDADGLDRSLSLIRLENGKVVRAAVPAGSLELRKADGSRTAFPWSSVRSLAVRKKLVRRTMPVHSLRHCTQVEYLDTGVVLTPASKADITANGFVRLSWNEDGWATDADGLKKPGSPAYKTNLVAGHPFGALVGRVGAKGDVFFIGKRAAKTGLPAGRLGLAVNDNAHWQNNLGTYTVTLTATDAYDLGEAQ
jgi:hypothetical protein